MAQEILTTFETEIDEVRLRPCRSESGRFRITCEDEVFWCRKRDGGFPEIKILKQRIRDFIAPQMNLGHSDCAKSVRVIPSDTKGNLQKNWVDLPFDKQRSLLHCSQPLEFGIRLAI